MSDRPPETFPQQTSPIGRWIGWCLRNRLPVALGVIVLVVGGAVVAPFDWDLPLLPRDPVPTDAIPDIGENQQILFTQWPGRSPQDVEDQITYPLAAAMQGVPGVKSIRSKSMFGFSTIYLIFSEEMGFDESRTRILEKLSSLQAGRDYPEGTQPQLGPDATALGQIYWYTLEGRDRRGEPVGGWDLEELRTIQDWYVRLALLTADGVSETASVGGFVREYQVDVDPDAMRAYKVTLPEVVDAVRSANIDVGAKTLELNNVEYFIRGIGFVQDVADLENSVVVVRHHVPVTLGHVATVRQGPALRRGVLDKGGAEAVGGVVVARYGENPLAVIKSVKEKIAEISPGLPAKVILREGTSDQTVEEYARRHGFEAWDGGQINTRAWLSHLRRIGVEESPDWVRISQVTVVPFYDRTGLIYETLGTLRSALTEEMLITFIVVILMVMHLRASVLIGGMLPLAVLLCFIAMKLVGVDANVVALSGIAIAIGTIVDVGIVVTENILRHLDSADPDEPRRQVVHRAASEVGSAVLTAIATTVVSFLPVFTMIGAEGKLFKPLAFTKTFTLIASILIALTVLPPAAQALFCGTISRRNLRRRFYLGLGLAGVGVAIFGGVRGSGVILLGGVSVIGLAGYQLWANRLALRLRRWAPLAGSLVVVLLVGVLLARHWQPLGPQGGRLGNLFFVAVLIGGLLGVFRLFQWAYPWMLGRCLEHKRIFLGIVLVVLLLGVLAWRGFDGVFGFVPDAVDTAGGDAETVRSTTLWVGGASLFPGLGKEFMPDLDEGSFLWMPTTTTHASLAEAMDILSLQDKAFAAIPEIDTVVGKVGRAETPLDPAPISMIETVITYKPEYLSDDSGHRRNFALYDGQGRYREDGAGRKFQLGPDGRLVPDPGGLPFRQWRAHIQSPDDIWEAISQAARIPGTTGAPKLMPIKARLVMLQSGMRAPMGVKVKGPDLPAIEQTALDIERMLKQVPGIDAETVVADRIIGKPYLHIVPDRHALKRYGVTIRRFQDIVETAVGGRTVTQTVQGRQRFGVRVRYLRELRNRIESLERVLIPARDGTQVPLRQLAEIQYVRGPQMIKSEDAFLVGYVLFDKLETVAEVDVVERAREYLAEKIDAGELTLPAGVSYTFAGNYQNQVRSARTLAVVLPVALAVIVLILYFQFKRLSTTLLVFSGIFVAWAGGFILLWLYGRPWFLDVSVLGTSMRELFQVHPMNLSVAVWVGFLALFGIATDNGVIQSTYLDQVFRRKTPQNVIEIRQATVTAALRRIRPCLMTSATTLLALLPVLSSTGRGSDVMVPMAIPSFGGMLVVLLSVFMVPVLYCWIEERKLHCASEIHSDV